MNWSPHIKLLLVSVSTSRKTEIGLPGQCKNMTPGKPNSLYKKKPIHCSKNVRHEAVLFIVSSIKSSTENEKIKRTQEETNAWSILVGP